MLKVVKLTRHIPLIDIQQMEEDGVDAFERVKMQMAVQIVYDMPKELFDKLFKTIILNPKDEKQWNSFLLPITENQTVYRKAKFEKLKMLKNMETAEIEMILQINTD